MRKDFLALPGIPHLQRAAEGVLHDIFRQRQVVDAEDARQRRNETPRLTTEQVLQHGSEGLRPSDSSTPSLARRFAGSLAALVRIVTR